MITIPMLKARLRAFAEDTRGNITIETLIWMPLILVVLGATFSFHEAFRQKSLNTKAAFTISDALSRETEPINDAYMDGMLNLLEYLTSSSGPYSIRVTMVRYDVDNGHQIEWSQTRGAFTKMDVITMGALSTELPTMLDNETLIIVETQTDFTPAIEIEALQPQQFYNFVFSRPRFAPRLVWDDGTTA